MKRNTNEKKEAGGGQKKPTTLYARGKFHVFALSLPLYRTSSVSIYSQQPAITRQRNG